MPAKVERYAFLEDRLVAIAAACDLLPEPEAPPRSIRIMVDKGPNIVLKGWTVFQWDGKPNSDKRFLRLALHYCAAGAGQWVAEMSWCSDRPGETDITKARPVATVREVMETWDWSAYAKQAAKQMHWDVALRIGGDV